LGKGKKKGTNATFLPSSSICVEGRERKALKKERGRQTALSSFFFVRKGKGGEAEQRKKERDRLATPYTVVARKGRLEKKEKKMGRKRYISKA